MLILTENNKVVNTDTLDREAHYGVLSFKDYKNPDFFFPRINRVIEQFSSASVTLHIGPHTVVMPILWSILCSDYDTVENIPLHDFGGKNYSVLCVNPIDGYMPTFYPLRMGEIYPNTVWTAPQIGDKDMLVVPLGPNTKMPDRGPECAIFSASKMDVNKPLSDIF